MNTTLVQEGHAVVGKKRGKDCVADVHEGCKYALGGNNDNMPYSGNPTPAPTTTTTTTTIFWNASELNKFINLMIDNVRNGQKSNSTFNKVGWNNIKAGLEATFQRLFRKEQLRNKMNKLRDDYNSFRRLLETMGFGWDSNTWTAIAADSVWENAIKANPNWTKVRKSGFPWWPELLEVSSNSSARGDRGVSQHIADCEDENDTHDSPEDVVGLDDIEPTVVDEVVSRSITKRKRDRIPTDRRKKSTIKVITNSAHDFNLYVAWKMKRGSSGTPTSRTVLPTVNNLVDGMYSIKACQVLLDNMTELTERMWVKAQQKIHKSAAWRISFVEVVAEKRMWMIRALK
ncbi:uncharacterized protein At2g29880-like [Macadamia integrifolia]|uniref:uncharacterized protein At2g29880-like n=1 Tax=Macadamia integrifolia TaxID=60698 RepID=UPI001C4F31B2|nr:uncharacterized protein At2g29880-like [Macadamia integrifolia]